MTITKKSTRFRGGYAFRKFSGQPENRVVTGEIPARAAVHLGSAAAVRVGDEVGVGTPLTSPEEDTGASYRPTVSPFAGRVTSVTEGVVAIETAGSQEWSPVTGYSAEWANLSREAIEDLLVATGSTTVCGTGIPTGRGTAIIASDSVRHVILHHPSADVFVSPVEAVLGENPAVEIATGVAILKRLLPDAECHLVLAPESRELLGSATREADAKGSKINAHTGSENYPQFHDSVLVQTVTGSAVPEGRVATDVGVLVLDVAGLKQIVDAVTLGKPYIERGVALAGPIFTENLTVVARFGSPISTIVAPYLGDEEPPRIVANSAMTGRALNDLDEPLRPDWGMLIALPEGRAETMPFVSGGLHKDSVTRTFLSALIAGTRSADINLHGDERPCVACTYCEQVCPAGILPYHLHRYVERDIIDEDLVRYGVFRCIDCNLCTYVCPSKIPLASLMAEGKEKLRAEGYGPVGHYGEGPGDAPTEGDAI